jgi:hypothetical protein
MCCLEIQYWVENYGFQTISFGVDKNSILEKNPLRIVTPVPTHSKVSPHLG